MLPTARSNGSRASRRRRSFSGWLPRSRSTSRHRPLRRSSRRPGCNTKTPSRKPPKEAAKEQPKNAEPKPPKEAAKQQLKDFAAKAPKEPAKDQPKDAEPKPQEKSAKQQPKDVGPERQEAAKQSSKSAETKQQETSKQRLKDEGAKLQEGPKHQPKDADQKQQETSKRSVKDAEPKPEKEAAKPHSKDSEPKSHKQVAQEPAKVAEPKHHQQDAAKHHDDDKELKHHQQEAAKDHTKDAEPKHHQQDGAKQHGKDKEPQHHQQEAAKEHSKGAEPKPQQQDAAKHHDKDKEPQHHQQEAAKEHSKEAEPKHHQQDGAKQHRKDHEKDKEPKPQEAAPTTTSTRAVEAPQAQQPQPAVQPAPAAKPPTAPLPTDLTVTALPPASKPANQDAPQPAESEPAEAVTEVVAPQPAGSTTQQTSTPFAESASKLGGPAQENSAEAPTKVAGPPQQAAPAQQVASAPDDKLRERARKVDDRGGGRIKFMNLFPPSPDTFKHSEILAAAPPPRVVEEMKRRGYAVERPQGSGLMLVILPPGAGDAWQVQRELETKFPGQSFGLNFIYKPYHAQAGVPGEITPKPPTLTKGCTDESCPWRKQIDWRDSVATCAAGLRIGMIDTRVDDTHPAIVGQVTTIDLALKQDALPARHWHGTGVVSVMAGKPASKTPGLIPGAKFTAVNVFFTNKSGELETDTAHLTEALDRLEKERAQIVNMSLVGPRDELVRDRIVDMARKGVVFVAAAGNGGPHAPAGYPAAYEEVIAVTAVDRKGGNYDHANRGAYIDVAAPGVQIWTALPEGEAGFLSGTSFAAPFVTAVAAVAYRDSGLDRAVTSGRVPLDPKGVMLAQLFSKEEQRKRNPISGLGLIKAPSTCGALNVSARDQPWLSVVKPTPSVPVSAMPLARAPPEAIALDAWQSVIQRASLPSGAAR